MRRLHVELLRYSKYLNWTAIKNIIICGWKAEGALQSRPMTWLHYILCEFFTRFIRTLKSRATENNFFFFKVNACCTSLYKGRYSSRRLDMIWNEWKELIWQLSHIAFSFPLTEWELSAEVSWDGRSVKCAFWPLSVWIIYQLQGKITHRQYNMLSITVRDSGTFVSTVVWKEKFLELQFRATWCSIAFLFNIFSLIFQFHLIV